MREAITTLWDELSGLAEDYSGLGKQFQQASRRLQTPGALPESELTEKVVGLRSRFGSLRSRLESAGATLAVSAPPTGGAETLRDLALWLEELTAAEERAARRAARDGAADGVLERVLALRHDREPAFEPLERCREQARTLRDGIRSAAPGLDEVRDALADNDHPFAYLLIMVGGAEGVSDDLWEGLFEAVGREFGRPLAAAAARGKLVAGEPEPAAREPVEVPEEPARDTGRGADAPVVVTLRRDAGSPPLRGPLGPSSGRKEPIADRGVIDPALVALTSEDLLTPIAEEAFPFLPGGLAALLASNGKARHAALRAVPRVERLETVRLLSCNVIAGHVFLDANNNGLLESSETRVPGNVIELRNADGIVVGRATTGADGSYSFSTDGTVSTEPVSVSQSLAIPATPTNFAAGLPIARFDPSLGALLGVEITVQGRLSSLIRAENTSAHSSQTIQATVEGELRLAGPGFDFSATLANSGGSFDATAFDGAADYGGTSGHDFGVQTATIDRTFVLSRDGGDDLSSFVGSGELAGTFEARASSRATGGGNIDYDTRSTGEAVVTVVYRYTPDNCLAPGNYTLVQPDQPPGTLNGKRSSEGDVFAPPASGPDTIPVTLDGRDLLDNDFGELLPADLSGFVYVDANNDGVRAASEAPIPGAALTLTGTDDLGNPVSRSAVTAADGAYLFDGLRPGTYRIVETQPAGFLDGKDSVGSLGGTAGDDRVDDIVLAQGADGVDYNFGELLPARLAGFVYVDANNDGLRDAGESPIPAASVTLTGTDDLGNSVSRTVATDVNGGYAFDDLRPGTYEIAEAQPAGYLDGKDAVGSQGGSAANDRFFGIELGQGGDGIDNNFGELLPSSLAGFVYFDRNDDGVRDAGEPGIAGTLLTLTGTDDLGNPVALAATTAPTGAYSFTNLRPGTYRIVETQPAGFLDGKDSVGSLGGVTGDDAFSAVVLGQGADGVDYNFGEISVASLSGFVYHDRDDDGLKAPGEPGIPGVTVTLTGTDDGGNPVAIVAVTDADGAYSFPSLRPGSYRIEETQPAGYLDGTDALGSQGGVLGDDRIDVTSLLQGVHGVDNNFGEVLPGGLNGFVYFDANRNGLRDPGERGFAGIPIRLNGTNALGAIDPQFVTTDENGFYSFGGLRPGAYSVTQTVQPAVFVDGQETRGNVFPLDGSRGTDEIPGITVNAGGVAPDNNFGEEVVPRVEPEVITQVEDVTRLGIHHQPTRFLLRFSNEVDPGSAGDPANYRLVQASWSGRLARRPIPLRSAAYDPPTRTVTLTTLRPINIYRPYQLTVNGVLDAQGDPIDGDRDGNPGGAFVTTVTRANYPYPLNPAAIQAQKAVEWAGKYPRLAAQRLAEGPRPRRS